MKPNYSN